MKQNYFSQLKQDRFMNEVIFNHQKNGFFIDIGAHDGVTISNTLYFENKGWNGICIEPNPNVFVKLQANRKSKNLNVCIGNANRTVKFTKIDGYSEMLSGISENYDPRHLERIDREIAAKGGEKTEIDVAMITLDSIEGIKDKQIDFISIDTEGNEFDIVKSINFDVLRIKALVIENNYNDNRIKDLLKIFGYERIYRLECDEVFIFEKNHTLGVKIRLLSWKINSFYNRVLSKITRKVN